jgi:hypothetical protein
MRALLIDKVLRTDLMLSALAINAVLLIASFAIFLALLKAPGATARCSGRRIKARLSTESVDLLSPGT